MPRTFSLFVARALFRKIFGDSDDHPCTLPFADVIFWRTAGEKVSFHASLFYHRPALVLTVKTRRCASASRRVHHQFRDTFDSISPLGIVFSLCESRRMLQNRRNNTPTHHFLTPNDRASSSMPAEEPRPSMTPADGHGVSLTILPLHLRTMYNYLPRRLRHQSSEKSPRYHQCGDGVVEHARSHTVMPHFGQRHQFMPHGHLHIDDG